ncbi:MAG: CCA tRNA nucleotidyltransferase, partial [Candidatus Angelobacter sp.]
FDGHAEIGTKMAEEICHRFRLSNEDTDQVLSLVANHMRFGDVARMKDSTLKRFFRLPRFEQHLELHRLDCQSSHRDLSLYDFAREKFHALPAEQIRPRPLITGADLIAAGYKPGPQFKELLTAVEDAQLDEKISTREEAMELVQQRARELKVPLPPSSN